MMRALARRLSYANVMATVAAFVALGGTSYAVATGSIGSVEIRDGSVRSVDVRDRTLTSRDLSTTLRRNLNSSAACSQPIGGYCLSPTGFVSFATAAAQCPLADFALVQFWADEVKGQSSLELPGTSALKKAVITSSTFDAGTDTWYGIEIDFDAHTVSMRNAGGAFPPSAVQAALGYYLCATPA